MTFFDKCGFPVETIKGRPVVNFIRLILWTNIHKTIQRIGQPMPLNTGDSSVMSYRQPVLKCSTEDKPWMKFKGTLPLPEGEPIPSCEREQPVETI